MLKSVEDLKTWVEPGQPNFLYDVLKELQGLKVTPLAAGAAAATNIAVAGVLMADTLVAVVNLTDATSLSAEAAITSNGNIQCAITDTSAKKLLVFWFHKG